MENKKRSIYEISDDIRKKVDELQPLLQEAKEHNISVSIAILEDAVARLKMYHFL